MAKNSRVCTALVLFLAGAGPALPWGCRGHEAVALIAFQFMKPENVAATNALLEKYPIELTLSCTHLDGLATGVKEATWADDYRFKDEKTAEWHFIDVPLNDPVPSDTSGLCAKGCVNQALMDQIKVFQGDHDSVAAANAIRFIIHLVGDAHQPLHDTTNNDRGGNCIPTAFLKTKTKLNTKENSYDPELHSVWDKYIIDSQAKQGASAFADSLWSNITDAQRTQWSAFDINVNQQALILSWITDSHSEALMVSYANLVSGKHHTKVDAAKIAGPDNLAACTDDNFQTKMAKKNIQVTTAYVNAALPVIQMQLEEAGIRLGRILDQLWSAPATPPSARVKPAIPGLRPTPAEGFLQTAFR